MKHIFKISHLALFAALVVFAGCKKDNGSDDEEITILPKDEGITILPKKVTKIVESDGYDYSYTYIFDSEGRIIQEINNDNDVYTYQYTSNLITRTLNSIDTINVTGPNRIEYNMENGRISSYVLKSGEQGAYTENGRPLFNVRRATCSYFDNGYISKIEQVSEIHTEEPSSVTEYTIENGCVVTEKHKSWVSDSDEYDNETNILYTYNSTLNNLNVNLWFIISWEKPIMDYFGTRFKKLPSTEMWGTTRDYSYSYEYDGEYIIKIVRSYGEGTKDTQIWDIFYE